MPKEHPLVTRKKQRIAEKQAELVELKLRCEALERGIAEDEADLEAAKPKQARVKKAKASPVAAEGQADHGA